MRMGKDKGLLQYHGKPQREFLVELLSHCCAHVYYSCKTVSDISPVLNPLPDQYPLESPLNGILTAFTFRPDVAWLSVPVDMPGVDLNTLLYLLQHRDAKKYATCFYDSEGKKPEPLLAIWEPKAFPELLRFYETGNISPRKFLMDHDIQLIKAPDPGISLNINDPEEFTAYFNHPDQDTDNGDS